MDWYYARLIPPGLTGGTARPVETLTVVALQFYALLALFVVGLVVFRLPHKPDAPAREGV
jgi:hypothetical protein